MKYLFAFLFVALFANQASAQDVYSVLHWPDRDRYRESHGMPEATVRKLLTAEGVPFDIISKADFDSLSKPLNDAANAVEKAKLDALFESLKAPAK